MMMVTRMMLPMLTLRITMSSSLDIDCNVSSIIEIDLTTLSQLDKVRRLDSFSNLDILDLTDLLLVCSYSLPVSLVFAELHYLCANVCKIVSTNNRLEIGY